MIGFTKTHAAIIAPTRHYGNGRKAGNDTTSSAELVPTENTACLQDTQLLAHVKICIVKYSYNTHTHTHTQIW